MRIGGEGLNGAGKSTLLQALAGLTDSAVIHFPNEVGTTTGLPIRSYLRGEWRTVGGVEDVLRDALVFQSLQVVNRLETMFRVEEIEAEHSHTVYLDRYWHSGWVYGQLDGLPVDLLDHMHRVFTADIHFLVAVPPEVALDRVSSRGREVRRYEKKLDAMKRADELYRELWDRAGDRYMDADKYPQYKGAWCVLDGEQSPTEVLNDAMGFIWRQLSL